MTRRARMAGLVVVATLLGAATAGILLLGAAPQGAQPVAADKGKLRILLGGKEVGTETFELAPSGSVWTERGETLIRVPGSADSRATGQLRLMSDGTPMHYEWTCEGMCGAEQTSTKASGTVDFQNGTAKTSINLGAKEPLLQDFMFASPRVAILDNNLYDQYALLAMLYDWNAAGTQTFPVLIPQERTPGTITIESLGAGSASGGQPAGLRVRSADLEIHAFFDAKRHLMRLEVPDANVVVVRE